MNEGAPAMSLARVQFFAVSLDGFGAGEAQTRETPFGHAGERLHEWMFATRWGARCRQARRQPRHRRRLRPALRSGDRRRDHGGREVRPRPDGTRTRTGRAVGSEPAVPHADLRAHASPARVDRDGGRHYLLLPRRSPAEELEQAREAADGKDVRIGGGATSSATSLAAGLIDHLHVAVSDPARPRLSALGRPGGAREGLRHRGHLLTQRCHASHVHPRGRLTAVSEA